MIIIRTISGKLVQIMENCNDTPVDLKDFPVLDPSIMEFLLS